MSSLSLHIILILLQIGTCIDIFQALLEGQNLKSVIYERVLSVIHLDIIQSLAKIGIEYIGIYSNIYYYYIEFLFR